jgi:hypothetical protein
MSKKQLILVSIVAAVPGALLLVFLVLGLLQGMLSDGATVSVTLWIVWVLAALGSASAAFLPFAIMFFPGLMPEPSAAIAAAPAGIAAAPQRPTPSTDDDEDEFEDGEEEFEEDADFEDDDAEDEGEQLFDDDALEDDFDDEFDDSFDKKR